MDRPRRPRGATRHGLPLALVCGLLAGVGVAASPGMAAGATPIGGLVRVDQIGYAPSETKVAYLLARRPAAGAQFRVVDTTTGLPVLTGVVGPNRGSWNTRYRAVHPVDISGLRLPGTYRIRVFGAATALSPPFRIGSRRALFAPLVADTLAFFRAQRDGAKVIPGSLHRKPSHLNDRTAQVYAHPTYENADSDVIVGDSLTPIDGTVNLAGGWFDAGDFIKFTHTTAYAEAMLLAARRLLGADAPAGLDREIRFGLQWLARAWDAKRGVLYIQVGIGSGNQDGTFNGDHDVWRLPEKDDTLSGPRNVYLRDRPAFRANDPGHPVPPNLAGRVAAAWAMAAQVDAAQRPGRARQELERAAILYDAAKKAGVGPDDVVTALPHAFYPESSWRDDLELATAELALAGLRLGDPRVGAWLERAAHWARAYIKHEAGTDTLNLYDTSALAHSDLLRAMHRAGHPAGLAVTRADLLHDLRAQLGMGTSRAKSDPFRSGVIYDGFDAAPHTFGLVVTAELYRKRTGDPSYADFATRQRDWAFGSNAWGVSLMIGAGSRFPECPQHVVANLSGHLDGTPPILRGAVVNGPNDRTLFYGGLGGFFDDAPSCPVDGVDGLKRFTGHGSRFVDDVRSWQTVEPALDFTAAATLALALQSLAH